MRVFETLARADASVAWIVMIGGASWNDLTGLPRGNIRRGVCERARRRSSRERSRRRASISPPVTAATGSPADGRSSAAVEHATWLFVDCVEGFADGTPELRIALLSPDQVVIEDTWTAFGLAGTGSHHIRVDDVVVPAERTFSLQHGEPCVDATVAHISPPSLYSTCLAALALGIAQGALDDIVALSREQGPTSGRRSARDQPHLSVRSRECRRGAARRARSLTYESAELMWATAEAGLELTLQQRARLRAGAVWVTDRAVSVVETAYRAGGGTAIYAECPLQRRLRDIHALTQHFLVRRDTLVTAGAVLAGQPVDVPVF